MPTSQRSALLFKGMRRYLRRYIGRHFHALRISRSGPLPELPRESAIVVVNHPSWWDPLVGLALTTHMPSWRVHYGPIESKGLAQYPFLERLGFFGVNSGTTRGVLKFLRDSQEILERPESILWITAQGRFTDSRVRPPGLKEGIGHLIHRGSMSTIVPLAIEYPFWNDRCPEILVRFGPPINIESGKSRPAHEWTALVESALQETQDILATEAMRRDPNGFDVILGGSAGVGGVYDLWRRLKARLAGKDFNPEHQAVAGSEPLDPAESPSPPYPVCETSARP